MTRTLQSLVAELVDRGDAPAVIAFGGPETAAEPAGKPAAEPAGKPAAEPAGKPAAEPAGKPAVLSYAELHRRVRRLAAGLLADVARPGDRVAVIGQNGLDMVVLRLALVAAGIVAAPLDDLAGAETLTHSIEDCGARALIADADILARVSDRLPDCVEAVYALGDGAIEDGAAGDAIPLASLLRRPEGSPRNDEPDGPLPEKAPGDLVAIIYTSGTTGTPKGVPLTHANFLANVEPFAAAGLADHRDRVLMPLPLHHAYPFVAGLLTPLACGAAIVLPASVSGPDIATALRESGATIMIGVPRLYEAMADGIRARIAQSGGVAAMLFGVLLRLSITCSRRLGIRAGRFLMAPVRRRFAPKLRMVGSGGAKLAERAAWTLEGLGFEVLTGYGLVETASVSTFNRPGRGRIGTEGRPLDGVEIRIVPQGEEGPDESGIGEIQIRGPHIFAGYYHDPETTSQVFTTDGWFKSGDLGRLDPDGSVVVTGRAKEIIVLSGGKNIAPEVTEKALIISPFIEDAAVLEKDGGLAALIVPDMAALRSADTARVDEQVRVAVTGACADLAPYQRVTAYRIWRQPLPKTRLGKLQRFELPDLYDRAEREKTGPPPPLSDADKVLLSDPNAAAVWKCLERQFPGRAIGMETSPQLDLNIDSLGWITLSHEIEIETGITLPEDLLADIVTVGGLLRHVAENAGKAREEAPLPPLPPSERSAPVLAACALLYGFNWLFHRVMFRLTVKAPLPVGLLFGHKGPMLVVANHFSDLDPILVGGALPWSYMRNTWWGAEITRVFTSTYKRRIAAAMHVFPVDDRRPRASLERARQVLERGDNLVWFPESWRSPDGRLQNFHGGVGAIIMESRPTVIPAWVEGAFEAMPRNRHLPRPARVTVIFGEPVQAETLIAASEGDDAPAEIAARARALVAALIPPGSIAARDPTEEVPDNVHSKPNA